ncbi:hypothetical protein C0581_04150 [Candidatus Parcubacteria bacterium]|nr:MAG: hypothetical protein C0581_04150 [Candidatus Parcubacteria bacterium]
MGKKKRELSKFEQQLNEWVADHLTRVKIMDKIFFLDHLRTMLHAGLSLVEGLNVLSKETENQKLKKIIADITSQVEKGKQLSEVLENYPKIFPSMYVKMIASGEVAGKLEESLEQIVSQMKKGHELSSSIKGAMIYPAVIVSAIVVVAILMVTVVLPKLTSMFDEFESELPLATKVLIAITDFMSKPLNVVLLFGAIVGLIVLFVFSLKKSPQFKDAVHGFNLKLPIFGQVIKQINLARFSLTLSSLLKSTLPIVEAIDITGDTCSNMRYQKTLHAATERVKTGIPLSEILMAEEKLFPPMVTEMIMVGEKTGEIDRLLNELSNFYAGEVDKTMKNFSVIIEPVIIILLGLAVAGIAVAVIMPMFSLMQNF